MALVRHAYSAMVRSSPAGMILVASDGVIHFANARAAQMFGYSSEELVGQHIEALVPARLRENHSALRDGFLMRPSQRAIGVGRDLRAERKDGTEFPAEIALTPIEAGADLFVMATILDISVRKAAEQALARRAAELSAAVEGAVDGIIMIDEEGVIQWHNPATARLFGYDSVELVGQNVSVLMPEPYHSEHDSYLHAYLQTGVAKILGIGREVEGRRKDGSIFPIDLSVSNVPLVGKRLFAGFVRDLSERHQLEARMEELHVDRLRAIGGVAAALAHEVSQPLSASALYLKTARRLLTASPEARGTRVDDVLDNAAEQIIRAGRIVSNLREFVARGEPNKLHQNLHPLINDALDLVRGAAKQAKVLVVVELTAQNDHVLVDHVQIKQVLFNLMRNAIEAMSQSESRVLRISTRSIDGVIRTDVVDTGCGLPAKTLVPLFEAFAGTKKGMGIGLSISRSIVEAHYGRIWAEPNPQAGTTFSFTLPLEDARSIG